MISGIVCGMVKKWNREYWTMMDNESMKTLTDSSLDETVIMTVESQAWIVCFPTQQTYM